jgi:polar amino acid transport system substrate-binding protein
MRLRTWFRIAGIPVLAFVLPGAALAESSLDKVKQSGVIKVCLAQQQPDNYKDPRSGQWTGIMVDLLSELAKWMKVKVDIAEVGWDVAVLSLKQGVCLRRRSSIRPRVPWRLRS